ncbi:HAD family phosphatase [Acidaminobacter sp. JC074]|uniref:HAD family hydrolase n=1 Tax=Acidaminobacter sp. JC074 TaxID=2530199 RepID=UPI001F0F2FC5|nr:HAD family phosphatase [Acidaminobacter sp. JC074]MCH4891107.1 HAD family phosphatase [Acidaminobacter sp. JC074]
MIKDYTAVIFDLDGTLVDSMWIWEQIDIDYLKEKGHELPEDLQKEIEGCSFTETAQYFKDRFKIEDDIETIKARWIEMSKEFYAEKIVLKKGIQELLDLLREKGIKMGIATSNSRELAESVLVNNKINDYFEVLVTSCDVKKGKPEPDVFLKAAELMRVSPEECLVFEDTHAGVLAGKSAGMDVIAIYDALSEEYMEEIKASADHYLMCYSELV